MRDTLSRSREVPPVPSVDDRLESWKEIAAYLKRDVSTVQRWEKRDGLPVHRLPHDKLGSVYAFKAELDAWWNRGSERLEPPDAAPRWQRTKEALDVTTLHAGFARFRAAWRRVAAISVALLAAAAIGGAVVWLIISSPSPTPPPISRSIIALPPDKALFSGSGTPALAISPDGRRVVYAAFSDPLASQLYIRALDEFEAQPVPGTEGASAPFFSPDGAAVAFFAAGELKKVALGGGAPVVIAKAPNHRGGSWGADDSIVFAPDYAYGLARVPASGGTPDMLTRPDYAAREKTHRFPEVLPGGKAVIFTTGTADIESFDDARIEVLLLETGERRVLLRGGTNARYVSTGHLLYAHAGSLYAVAFDVTRLAIVGSPVRVLDGIPGDSAAGHAHFAVSRNGTLVYGRGGGWVPSSRLVLADRTGRLRTLVEHPGLMGPRLSPDGQRIAVSVGGATAQVWIFELSRGTLTRLTAGWDNETPVWTVDGARVIFFSNREGTGGLYSQTADGGGPAERLTHGPGADPAWSADGAVLAVLRSDAATATDIWGLRAANGWEPEPLVREPFDQRYPAFSPDGRWLAYMSNETGKFEVYVRPYPELDAKWRVSTEGGRNPVWARNGRELFYREESQFFAVAISADPFRAGKPVLLFTAPSARTGRFDVTADGQFVLAAEDNNSPREVAIVLNWVEELRKLPVLAR
jgi:serine/threonine-protein kinase